MTEDNVLLHETNIVERQKKAQQRIFRLANRDHGLTLKAISLDTGIGYSTIQTWANGSSVMSITSLFQLVGVIPNELLSLLLPSGHIIVEVPEGIDHDIIAPMIAGYLRDKDGAHHPDSPGGREISDCERTGLDEKFIQIVTMAAAA